MSFGGLSFLQKLYNKQCVPEAVLLKPTNAARYRNALVERTTGTKLPQTPLQYLNLILVGEYWHSYELLSNYKLATVEGQPKKLFHEEYKAVDSLAESGGSRYLNQFLHRSSKPEDGNNLSAPKS